MSDRFSPNSKSLRYQYRRIKLCQTFRHNTRLCKELRHILNSAIIWNNLNLLVEETVRVHCNTLKYENKYGRSFLAKIAEGNYFMSRNKSFDFRARLKNTITYHNALCLSPQNFTQAFFSVSLRAVLTPKRNRKQCLRKILW